MRDILHIDMDAFYASVEEFDDPALRGKPVIVGGTPEGRGVVAAANYEARRFGVHSAMPAGRARRLCPDGIFLRPRMARYAEVSHRIREIFHRYTPLVEPLSLDEAFLDVTGSRRLFGPGPEVGRRIKADIAGELGLTASVGAAPNKFLAKLASDLDKPNGFVVVEPEQVQAFLDPLPVGRLWGVGKVSGETLRRLGIDTVAQLRRRPREELQRRLGQWGDHLWRLAQGLDERPVVPDHEAKSISHETTFAADIDDAEVLHAWLVNLTEQVARRLRRHDLKGRTVQIKLRYSDFKTITRARTLSAPTDVTRDLSRAAETLLREALGRGRPRIRLLGMGVTGFEEPAPEQGDLFGEESEDKQRKVDAVSDDIMDRFGTGSLKRGTDLKLKSV